MTKSLFEDEMFPALRRRASLAHTFAGLSLLIAVLAVAAMAAMIPLKTTEAFLVVVDRATGETQRVAAMEPVTMTEKEALTEAHLVAYVTDRETFDRTGAEARVNAVLDRSQKSAREDWIALWTPASPDYPPKLYGPDDIVTVKVTSVSLLEAGVAQVRFTKTAAWTGIAPSRPPSSPPSGSASRRGSKGPSRGSGPTRSASLSPPAGSMPRRSMREDSREGADAAARTDPGPWLRRLRRARRDPAAARGPRCPHPHRALAARRRGANRDRAPAHHRDRVRPRRDDPGDPCRRQRELRARAAQIRGDAVGEAEGSGGGHQSRRLYQPARLCLRPPHHRVYPARPHPLHLSRGGARAAPEASRRARPGLTGSADYQAAGAADFRPLAAWDDGTNTYFRFAPDARRPAIFRTSARGEESSVNATQIDPTLVQVNGLSERWTLRIGPEIVCVIEGAPPESLEAALAFAPKRGDAHER